MNKEIVIKFKALFEEQKNNLTFSKKVVDESFQVAQDEMMDEADLTASEMETNMRMRLRNREALFMRKVDEALERISLGTFGECDCCGEDIELKRLEARPTATQCVGCKEEAERMESLHIDGHRYKSLGAKLRLA
jgi:DnaK suppressor protein